MAEISRLPDNSRKGFPYYYSISVLAVLDKIYRLSNWNRQDPGYRRRNRRFMSSFSVRLHQYQVSSRDVSDFSCVNEPRQTRTTIIPTDLSTGIVANKWCLITKITPSTRERERERERGERERMCMCVGVILLPQRIYATRSINPKCMFQPNLKFCAIEREFLDLYTLGRSLFLLVIQRCSSRRLPNDPQSRRARTINGNKKFRERWFTVD